MKKVFLAAALAAGTIATAGAAQAQTSTLLMQGQVAQQCGVTFNGIQHHGLYNLDFTGNGSRDVPMGLTCNVPFGITAKATNGGFQNAQAINQNYEGGTNEVEYNVVLSVNGVGSLPSVTSDQLANGFSASAALLQNTAVFGASGNLNVRWLGASKLYAGTYQDTITVTVTPAP